MAMLNSQRVRQINQVINKDNFWIFDNFGYHRKTTHVLNPPLPAALGTTSTSKQRLDWIGIFRTGQTGFDDSRRLRLPLFESWNFLCDICMGHFTLGQHVWGFTAYCFPHKPTAHSQLTWNAILHFAIGHHVWSLRVKSKPLWKVNLDSCIASKPRRKKTVADAPLLPFCLHNLYISLDLSSICCSHLLVASALAGERTTVVACQISTREQNQWTRRAVHIKQSSEHDSCHCF